MAFTMNVSERKAGEKATPRQLRREGKVPGVVYGHKFDPVNVAVESKQLNAALHQSEKLIEGYAGPEENG